jgi:hypothetical protein
MVACFSKTVVFFVNLIFLLAGLAVLIFGIIVLAAPTTAINGLSAIPGITSINYIIDINQMLLNAGILLTVMGSVIFLMCFIGLLGTCAEGGVLLIVYAVLLVLTTLFELGVIIYVALDYRMIESRIQGLMLTSLQANFAPVVINDAGVIQNSTSPPALAWETMQFDYACCGAKGYEDFATFNWQTGPGYNYTGALVPPSCCMQIVQYQVPSSTGAFADLNSCLNSASQSPQYVNTQGCYVPMMARIAANEYVVSIIFACLVALEVIVLIFTMRIIGVRESSVGVFA